MSVRGIIDALAEAAAGFIVILVVLGLLGAVVGSLQSVLEGVSNWLN